MMNKYIYSYRKKEAFFSVENNHRKAYDYHIYLKEELNCKGKSLVELNERFDQLVKYKKKSTF